MTGRCAATLGCKGVTQTSVFFFFYPPLLTLSPSLRHSLRCSRLSSLSSPPSLLQSRCRHQLGEINSCPNSGALLPRQCRPIRKWHLCWGMGWRGELSKRWRRERDKRRRWWEEYLKIPFWVGMKVKSQIRMKFGENWKPNVVGATHWDNSPNEGKHFLKHTVNICSNTDNKAKSQTSLETMNVKYSQLQTGQLTYEVWRICIKPHKLIKRQFIKICS